MKSFSNARSLPGNFLARGHGDRHLRRYQDTQGDDPRVHREVPASSVGPKGEGVDLPSKVAAYLLYRQANLDREADSKFTTWIHGDYSLDTVLANLRRLDRVSGEGKKGNFFEERDAEEAFDEDWQEDGVSSLGVGASRRPGRRGRDP